MQFLSFLILLVFVVRPSYALHVIIDPGHGGHDKGALAKDLNEAEVTLKVGQYLNQIIADHGSFTASLTRSSDQFVGLEDRAKFADAKKGQVFLSIHVNSSKDSRAQGKEIYFQNQLPADQEALFLASLENQGFKVSAEATDVHANDISAIVSDLKRNHRIYQSGKFSEFLHQSWVAPSAHRRRPIRQAPFHVISSVSMPSALVEIGYLSNKKDLERLGNETHLKKVAEGLFSGLKQFKEFVDKKTLPHLN